MRHVLAVASLIMAIVLCLIGLAWMLLMLAPLYAFVGAVAYYIWRAQRRHADIAANLERSREQERHLNAQEYRAWRTAAEEERQTVCSATMKLRGARQSR